MPEPTRSRYPLLEEILSIMGLPLKATYTNQDLAGIFGCTVRTIQDRVASGKLASRELIGRAKFLPADIEEFLKNSKKDGK